MAAKGAEACVQGLAPAGGAGAAMAGKGVEEHPIHMAKWVINNLMDGIVDDLMKKNVLTEDEFRKAEKGVNLIMKNTENLIDSIVEKTKMVHQILVDNALNVKQQLSLKSQSDSEDDAPENESPSSLIESEDGREEQRDEEEAGLAQALPSPPAAPQEMQAAQPEHNLKLCTRDDFDEIRTAMADHIYPVMEREGRTRLALIICNKEFKALEVRKGSEVDLKGMEDLLANLGYSVVVERNLTALEMEAVLWEFAARQEHRSSDSTFLVFMTHGILDGICGTMHTDNEPDILRDETIFQIFNNRNCQNLINKPKVIIMQACRGKGTGTTWVPDMGEVSLCRCDHTHQCYVRADAVRKDHVEKDFVAFKSSTPNNISWINESHGSFFIQRLINCFKEFACCNHLQEIFRKVQHSFETPSELAQMPTIERVSMTRHFYLFPGI